MPRKYKPDEWSIELLKVLGSSERPLSGREVAAIHRPGSGQRFHNWSLPSRVGKRLAALMRHGLVEVRGYQGIGYPRYVLTDEGRTAIPEQQASA